MKWGVRKYQFADGTRTPAGIQRYYANKSSGQFARTAALSRMRVKDLTNMARTQITGKQYADTYMKKGTHSHEYKQAKSSRISLSMLHIKNKIQISIWAYSVRI